MTRTVLRRALSATAVLALAAGSLLVAAPANAIPGLWSPDPATTPAGGATVSTNPVDFSWDAKSGYSGAYRLSYASLGSGYSTVEVAGTSASVTLPDGSYLWYVGYKQGILWRESSVRTLTVDTTAPTVTLTTPAAGTIVAPGQTLLLTGLVTDTTFASATISLDGVPVATAGSRILLQAIGTTGLASGTHTITVTATDSFGREGSAAVSFVVDGDAPTATFTTPVDASYLAPGADLSVAATLADVSPVAAWTLTVDGAPVASGSGTAVAGTAPTTGWANASVHAIAVTATDSRGNTGTTTINVVADSRKPSVTITSPVVDAVVASTVVVGGTAADSGSGVASVQAEVRRINGSGGCGAVLAGAAGVLSGSTWTTAPISLAGIADGTYCIRAQVVDAVGNSANERVLPIVIDQTAPTAPTGLAPSGWVVDADTVSWDASSDLHGVHYAYELRDAGGALVASGSTDGTSASVAALAPGYYTLAVTATDDLGNASSSNGAFDVIGTPAFTAPADGTEFARDLAVAWTGVNAPGGVRRYEVEYVHALSGETVTANVTDGTTSLTRTFGAARPDGEWQVRVRAVYETRVGTPLDRFGPWSEPITVVHDLTGPVAPVLSTPAADSIHADDTFSFGWLADTDASSYVLRISTGSAVDGSGRLVGSIREVTSATSVPAAGLADGGYWWQVRGIDALGNRGDWSQVRQVTLDRVAPTAVALASLANGSTVNGGNVSLRWFAPESGARYVLEYGTSASVDLDGSLVGATTVSASALTAEVGGLPAGTYHWHVKAVDAAGNAGAWSPLWSFTIAAPVATTRSVAQGGAPGENTADPSLLLPATAGPEGSSDGGSAAGSGEAPAEAPAADEPAAASDDTTDAGLPIGWIIAGLALLILLAGAAALIRYLLARAR